MDIAREIEMQLYLDEADDVRVADRGEEADLTVEAVVEVVWEARGAHLLHGHGRLWQLGPPSPPVLARVDRGGLRAPDALHRSIRAYGAPTPRRKRPLL
jgi:hypothetical protein